MDSIAIVDYQMGNLRSVQKALEHVGYPAVVSSDPEVIGNADKVILPGVGAFGDAIQELRDRELVPAITHAIDSGKPFLGICLGLQMLFDVGTEGREQPGLGIIGGRVERFDPALGLKIPHMGWNRVHEHRSHCPLFEGVPPDAHFYFVHSYYVVPENEDDCWLTSDYGVTFCASVWRDNVFATQFHPEKSQQDGLHLLKNFAQL